ncbi:MAG: hypothetical protein KF796_17945 [Ramlibacter sp.]|nr:hypothetical protein [Ramlibacter sp.]
MSQHHTHQTIARCGHAALLATCLAVLAACGGGGGGGTSPATSAPSAVPAPLATAVVVTPSPAAPAGAEADAAAGHFAQLNAIRSQLGVRALRWNGSLAGAAQAHADYLFINQASGHEEQAGLAGFTGSYIADRARAFGYGGALVQEAKTGGQSFTFAQGQAKMRELLLAPLHRLQLIAPEFDDGGVGMASAGGPLVTNVGSSGGRINVSQRRWMFPFDGQEGIAPSFMPGSEVGLADGLPQTTGTPLTLSGFMFSMLVYSDVGLFEAQSGEQIPLIPMAKAGDVSGALIFFPARPLKPLTRYTWKITASVDKQAASSSATFTTGA